MKTELEFAVITRLKERNLTLCTAESCTGGLIGKRLTDVSGSSAVYPGGIISYTNEVKHKLLGVQKKTLAEFTAVSAQTAGEMALGARMTLAADIAASVTGLAGPDGDGTGRPVGLVYIAISTEDDTIVHELHLQGSREDIRRQAADAVLNLILETV